MIVHPTTDSLLLIRQVDHAALAADLVAPWVADGWPERASRRAALLATVHHDDGWLAEDEAPSFDPSRHGPHDFLTVPTARRREIWRGSVAALRYRSSYATALVTQHAITLSRTIGVPPDWGAWLDEMERTRDECFTAPAIDPDVDPPPDDRLLFLRDYAMLALGDLMSLIVCNGWSEPQERDGYQLWLEPGHRLCVRPDPFGGRDVPFAVTGRRISGTTFPTAQALADAWAAGEPITLRGVAVGIPHHPS